MFGSGEPEMDGDVEIFDGVLDGVSQEVFGENLGDNPSYSGEKFGHGVCSTVLATLETCK